jgi:isopenicillin N synthase-like dioxygenase
VGEEWKARLLEYFELASQLGHVLNRVFALSLGLPENWFEDRIGPPLVRQSVTRARSLGTAVRWLAP